MPAEASRTPHSDALHARALTISPTGAQTMSKQRARYGAGMPAFLVSGRGARVTDLDGHEYVDWIASLAAVILGHAHPHVVEAMRSQLCSGGTLAMPHPLEVKLGERFLAATGWPDGMVRWVSTGSEATEAAVRVARIATGRDLVLSVGYHGWHSTWTAAKAVHPGVPDAFGEVIWDTPANDLAALHDRFERPGRRPVAAVILEPCADDPPDPVYLASVLELAHRHGALVISDEIIAGFRWHEHGAMLGTCGLRPDLVCFGKAIANGAFPIAALVGPRDLMAHAWPISGTANGHPLGLAAVGAVLDVFAQEQPLQGIHAMGRRLRAALAAMTPRYPWALVGGDAPRPTIRVQTGDPVLDGIGQTLLVQELATRGVLWHPAGAANVMAAHDPAHLTQTRGAMAVALGIVDEALADPDPARWLVGAPSVAALAVRP